MILASLQVRLAAAGAVASAIWLVILWAMTS
jgi:hypothetical protein